MSILITGGLGHIGSKLVRQLNTNSGIIVIDSLKTQRYSSLFSLNRNQPIHFIGKDLLDVKIADLKKLGSISTIIHLAAKNHSQEKKDENFSENIYLTKKVIEIAEEFNSHLIFPSSTSVYSRINIEMDENAPTDTQINPYSRTKIEEEALIMKSNLNYWTILRLASIYGISAGMRFHTAINKFCWDARVNKLIEVWGKSYLTKMPYLNVSDCVNVITTCLNQYQLVQKQVYNVCTDHHSTSEIIDVIQKLLDYPVELIFSDSTLASDLDLIISTNKIRELNFIAGGSLIKSVKETLNLFRGIF